MSYEKDSIDNSQNENYREALRRHNDHTAAHKKVGDPPEIGDVPKRTPGTCSAATPEILSLVVETLVEEKPARPPRIPVLDPTLPAYTIVDTISEAKRVAKLLLETPIDAIFACDTEVLDFDMTMGPWKNGEVRLVKRAYVKLTTCPDGQVICLSIYGGKDFDFGSGPGIWIDTAEDMQEMLEPFRPYFEDKSRKKVRLLRGCFDHLLLSLWA
jgi:hypothetical protein